MTGVGIRHSIWILVQSWLVIGSGMSLNPSESPGLHRLKAAIHATYLMGHCDIQWCNTLLWSVWNEWSLTKGWRSDYCHGWQPGVGPGFSGWEGNPVKGWTDAPSCRMDWGGGQREDKLPNSIYSAARVECSAQGGKCALAEATLFLSRTEQKTPLLSLGVIPQEGVC